MEKLAWLTLGIVLAVAGPASALINVKFTPADLVRGAKQIIMLEVGPAGKDTLPARVTETLKGAAPQDTTWDVTLTETPDDALNDLQEAIGNGAKATAIWFQGDFSGARDAGGDDVAIAGVLQVGGKWFGIRLADGKRHLDKDPLDISAVWGGSAPMLGNAGRQTLADPTLSFPVVANLKWARDQKLGTLKGPATGTLVVDVAGTGELAVVILSEGGDRVIQTGAKNGGADITDRVQLRTKSRWAVAGDFNNDGRLDIASWNGTMLQLAMQTAAGTFAEPVGKLELKEVLGLDVVGRKVVVSQAGAAQQLEWNDGWQPVTGDKLPAGFSVVLDARGTGQPQVVAVPGRGVRAATVGDFDADGQLEVVAAGGVYSGTVNRLGETGELEYHGMKNNPVIVGLTLVDLNRDGRAGVAAFYANQAPMQFFNRGFNTFGYARELDLHQTELPGAAALREGVAAGTMVDVDGDGVPDLLGVTAAGEVWVLFGKGDDREPLGVKLLLPANVPGPVAVAVQADNRALGLWQVSHSQNGVVVGVTEPGPVQLTWQLPGGARQSREVIVENKVLRFTIPATK